MTPEQAAHITDIQRVVSHRIENKYRRGQKEHGGNVWDRPALPDLTDEVTDLNVYLQTLEGQLKELHRLVHIAKGFIATGHPSDAYKQLEEMDIRLKAQLQRE